MTKKKILLITIPLIILILIGGWVIAKNRKPDERLVNPSIKKEMMAKEVPLKTWKDPLGFEFKYPENLTVDPHEEDLDNYAQVELTFKDHEGGIIIWSKDLLYKDLDDYLENDEEASGASVMETTLDKTSAKKLLIKSKDTNKIITTVIYDELLFLIEANLDKNNYWQKIYDNVVVTFSFGTVAGATETSIETSDEAGGEEEIQGEFEGEEVVE